MKPKRATIFVVDDDPTILSELTEMLRVAGYQVESFANPLALLTRLSPRDRGCVVLDLRMPGLSGLELQQALTARGVMLPVIFMSGRPDVRSVVAAMRQGAVDFLPKPIVKRELCAAVERALHKEAKAAEKRTIDEQSRARWMKLSAVEQKVCLLSARGMINKQVAAELGSVVSTVHAQRIRALKKLGLDSMTELVQLISQVGETS